MYQRWRPQKKNVIETTPKPPHDTHRQHDHDERLKEEEAAQRPRVTVTYDGFDHSKAGVIRPCTERQRESLCVSVHNTSFSSLQCHLPVHYKVYESMTEKPGSFNLDRYVVHHHHLHASTSVGEIDCITRDWRFVCTSNSSHSEELSSSLRERFTESV